MTRASVYVPTGRPGPGRLMDVDLDVLGLGSAELALADVTVRDENGDHLLSRGDLRFDPSAGGGPLAEPGAQRQARAFALVNTAYHVQRTMRYAALLLERSLPPLLVRIGMHLEEGPWGGGHYRLPARFYSELPETDAIQPTGEVHLGYGRRMLPTPAPGSFNAPGHNNAIIVHEVGHHLCRHTVDFRLNRLRAADAQVNRKIPLDEGTCDYLTAVMTGTPDIFGWHRSHIPVWQQRRRKLDARWTMAHFDGGLERDPHTDGTVWASALWSARAAVAAAGHPAVRFDAMVLRGLDEHGRRSPDVRSDETLLRRRSVAYLLESMLEADPVLAEPVLAAMAGHGIEPGLDNRELRDQARRQLAGARVA
jgi:hypothetical protein